MIEAHWGHVALALDPNQHPRYHTRHTAHRDVVAHAIPLARDSDDRVWVGAQVVGGWTARILHSEGRCACSPSARCVSTEREEGGTGDGDMPVLCAFHPMLCVDVLH